MEAGLVIAWSSGFIGALLAADAPSVFLVLFWRFVIVAVALSPFILHAVHAGPGSRELATQAALGALAMFGYLSLGVKAIDLGVPAGAAALISALQPLVTAALAGPVLGELVGRKQWWGLSLGFLGVLLAVGGAPGDAPWWTYGLSLAGMLALVAATLLAKARGETVPLLPALGIQSFAAAVLFALSRHGRSASRRPLIFPSLPPSCGSSCFRRSAATGFTGSAPGAAPRRGWAA